MITRLMWVGAAVLGLAAGTGFAQTTPPPDVQISDLTDNNPTVVLSGAASGFNVRIAPEIVSVTGLLPFTANGALQIPIESTSVALTEPSQDPFNQPISDVVTFTTSVGTSASGESVDIEFVSDSNSSPTAPPNAIMITETGALQDVTASLLSSPITISIASDLNAGEPMTPLPASAWAGMALLGGFAIWRIVRGRRDARAV